MEVAIINEINDRNEKMSLLECLNRCCKEDEMIELF